MKSLLTSLVAVLFLLLCPSVNGAEFRRLTMSDGLSDNSIYVVFKDSRGFLWIGTHVGLNRYDGFRFKHFFEGPDAIPDNSINDIFEDSAGHLWIHTPLGYSYMDLSDERVVQDPSSWLTSHGISERIEIMEVDAHGDIWAVRDSTLYKADLRSGKTDSWTIGGKPAGVKSTDLVFHEDEITLCCTDGRIIRIDPATMRTTSVETYITLNPDPLDKNYRLFKDSAGLEIIYSGELSWTHNTVTGEWTSHSLLIKDVAADASGRVWIATDHDGVLIYTPGEDAAEILGRRRSSDTPFLGECVQCLYSDNSGVMWLGTYKSGLSFIYDRKNTFAHTPLEDVTSILEDRSGILWFGTDGNGIIRYDPETGKCTSIRKDSSKLLSDIVVSSTTAPDGSLWFGGFRGGLTHFCDGKWTSYNTATGKLASNDIWDIKCSGDGKIYIGTLGAGLQVMDVATGESEIYNHENSALKEDHVSSLCFSRSGLLYIGHAKGVDVFDPGTGAIKAVGSEQLAGLHVRDIFIDSRDLLWIASNKGIHAYDISSGKTYSVDVRGNSINFNTVSVAEDSLGGLWVCSNNLLTRIQVNPGDDGWDFFATSYGTNEGVPDVLFNKNSMVSLRNGDILTGCQRGFVRIVPKDILDNQDSTYVIFSGIVLPEGEKNVEPHMTLSWKQRSFIIHLASSTIGKPGQPRFIFSTDGSKWTPTPDGMPAVQFANAKSGRMKLEVAIADAEGNASGPVSSLDITVRPPWYLSTQAILLYSLLALSFLSVLFRISQKRRKEREEKAISEMKQIFFINISHELRTPLSLILSPLSDAIGKEQDSQIKGNLLIAERNARKLLDMVNQMLDLRSLMMNAQSVHFSRKDLVDTVRSSVEQFLALKEKGITLTLRTSNAHIEMLFDEDKISKVVTNLLSNAIKYTDEGGRVDVDLSLDGSDAVIRVSDNGKGIPDKEKPHLFDRFWQGEGSANKGGSGIGLNIVREYVRMHEGRVEVSDTPGGGATFTVFIPAKECEASGEGFVKSSLYQEEAAADADTARSAAKRINLLLVDDSDDFLDYLSGVLSSEYNVIMATDGQEALKKMETLNPDIVVSDVMMPNMDGNELCRRIKANPATTNIPVVMLTARLTDENEKKSRDCGADDYFTKPFDIKVLQEHIAILVSRTGIDTSGKLKARIEERKVVSVDRKFVDKVTAFIEENIVESELSVEQIAEAMGMSRANIYRRMVSATGHTPSEFIKIVRLRHAERLLMQSGLTISEICYEVGFTSPRYFSKCYKEFYGYLPSQAKRNSES
ncbi:MAG: response regulator [Bacteroidales bacterium]|nr:response regulator [Bacteroidales bacterium]